jgi:hypothetical protein
MIEWKAGMKFDSILQTPLDYYDVTYANGHTVRYEKARPHGEWIPCSERLPKECENVLAWIERDAWVDGSDYPKRKQESAIGWHIEGRWHFDGYAGSTTVCLAWMPLPEPYKEEGGEK